MDTRVHDRRFTGVNSEMGIRDDVGREGCTTRISIDRSHWARAACKWRRSCDPDKLETNECGKCNWARSLQGHTAEYGNIWVTTVGISNVQGIKIVKTVAKYCPTIITSAIFAT